MQCIAPVPDPLEAETIVYTGFHKKLKGGLARYAAIPNSVAIAAGYSIPTYVSIILTDLLFLLTEHTESSY